MLLPKRKRLSKKIIPKTITESLLDYLEPFDYYILDNENAIVVNLNSYNRYTIKHMRLKNNNLVILNQWEVSQYSFDSYAVIKPFSLLKIYNQSSCSSVYDFANAKFIISSRDWDNLEFGPYNNCINKYKGILAYFDIQSEQKKDDIIQYINPVTNEEMVEDFAVVDGHYYAIINLDGTIRCNKLFKGSTFSKIEEIIDLNEYQSLADFKNVKKRICNEIKNEKRNAYLEVIKNRNNNNISPYLDEEVARILEIKYK